MLVIQIIYMKLMEKYIIIMIFLLFNFFKIQNFLVKEPKKILEIGEVMEG